MQTDGFFNLANFRVDPSDVHQEAARVCELLLARRQELEAVDLDSQLRRSDHAAVRAGAPLLRFTPLCTAPSVGLSLPTLQALWGVEPRHPSAEPAPRPEWDASVALDGGRRKPRCAPAQPATSPPPPPSPAPPRVFRAPRPLPPPPAMPEGGRLVSVALHAGREAAVRDYLRRMDLLVDGWPAEGPETLPVTQDALLNGVALCRLAAALPVAQGCGAPGSVVCHATPRDLQEVVSNYEMALRQLESLCSGADADQRGLLGVDTEPLRSVRTAFTAGGRSCLLLLYYRIIETFLPPPEDLPDCHPALRFFTGDGADGPSALSVDERAAEERRACELLTESGALPCPAAHQLPGDACMVPGPLRAPFLSSRTAAVVSTHRRETPRALCVPSVFPFLTNGVSLCRLADRVCCSGGRDDDNGPRTAPRSCVRHANPRTEACCLANIRSALAELFGALRRPLPPRPALEQVVRGVFSGDRATIAHVVCAFGCLTERAEAPAHPADAHVTPRAPLPSSRPPPPPATSGVPPTCAEAEWLRAVLGPAYRHTAEDSSFTVDRQNVLGIRGGSGAAAVAAWLCFSDGVVLAEAIKALECRRCAALECVRPTTRSAAKRFNIGHCLEFLRHERGATLSTPFAEKKIMEGDPSTVLDLLRLLRSTYKHV